MAELDPRELTKDDRINIALAEYKEVVAQFRVLTDIRFKLLTYLPLGTVAAAAFVPTTSELVKQPAIPAFAFIVTLCIAAYNKRNDQFYDELVARAAELERELQIEHGSFMHRPKPWLKYFGFVPVEHRWPIAWVYMASAMLWVYLFVDALDRGQFWFQLWQIWAQAWLLWLQSNSIWLKLIAPGLVFAGWLGLGSMEKACSKKQREAVKSLMVDLLGLKVGELRGKQAEIVDKIAARPILDVEKDKAKRRVACHWGNYMGKWDAMDFEQNRDPHASSRGAAALLAAVLDLPARWIEDVWSGRR